MTSHTLIHFLGLLHDWVRSLTRGLFIDEDTDEDFNEDNEEVVNEDIAQKTEGDTEQMIDVKFMVTINETTINKEVNEDEFIGVEDYETDEIEDISAYYKNTIIKLEGEVVEFDPQCNVSSSFVPIEVDSLSIIDIPASSQKEMARIRLANEANASRAKSKAKASLSQLFSDISSNPNAVQSEVHKSITNF